MGKCKRRYMHGKRRRKSPLKFGVSLGVRRIVQLLDEDAREEAYSRIESMKRGEDTSWKRRASKTLL